MTPVDRVLDQWLGYRPGVTSPMTTAAASGPPRCLRPDHPAARLHGAALRRRLVAAARGMDDETAALHGASSLIAASARCRFWRCLGGTRNTYHEDHRGKRGRPRAQKVEPILCRDLLEGACQRAIVANRLAPRWGSYGTPCSVYRIKQVSSPCGLVAAVELLARAAQRARCGLLIYRSSTSRPTRSPEIFAGRVKTLHQSSRRHFVPAGRCFAWRAGARA